MRRLYVHLLTLALGIAVVIALLASAPSAELYSPEDSASTPLHENTWAMKEQGREESERTLLLMQDLLDRTAPVTLSIRVRDFESAATELRRYREQMEEMGRLVISLDLSESSVEEFRQLSRENLADLGGLLEGCERFSELERLEVIYREQGASSSAVYSLTYEGETIQNELRSLYQDYLQRRGDMLNTSATFGLGAEAYEQSVADFKEIVEESERVQERRIVTLPPQDPRSRCTLTLTVTPLTALYMDRLSFSGQLSDGCGVEGSAILFVDSAERGRTASSGSGSVSFLLPVERLKIGTHIAYMQFGSTYSPVVPFRIEGAPARISFSAVETEYGIATCRGTLSARERPVAGARIRILDNGTEIRQATTDRSGAFEADMPLPEGMHRLKAVFDDSAFPLFPVESGAIVLWIHAIPEGREAGLPLLAIYLIVPGLSLMAAIWYVRRGKGRSGDGAFMPSPPLPAPDTAAALQEEGPVVEGLQVEASVTGEPAEVEERYRTLLSAGRAGEAVHLLYRQLAERLAEIEAITKPEALTPRELLSRTGERAYTGDLRILLGIHESVRYAGRAISMEEAESALLLYLSILGGLGHGDE